MDIKVRDLDLRLIELACVIEISECLPKSVAGQHICNQIIRSGTAPALQYGEAQGAESRADFIHKMKVALMELRETFNCLRLIRRLNWYSIEKLNPIIDENNQLISIFVKSILTAYTNSKQKNNDHGKG